METSGCPPLPGGRSESDRRTGRRTGQRMRVARAGGRQGARAPTGRMQCRADGPGVAQADARRESGAGSAASRAETATSRWQRKGGGSPSGPPQAPPAPAAAARASAAVGVRLGHARHLGLSPSARRRHEGQRGLQGPATLGGSPGPAHQRGGAGRRSHPHRPKVNEQMVVLMDPMEDPDDILRAHRSQEKSYMFNVAFDFTATQAAGKPPPCWAQTTSPASTFGPSTTTSVPSRRPATTWKMRCPYPTWRHPHPREPRSRTSDE
ncbi:collagen alpha-1(I) chain-like [Moschus berezovskii]|uniref:collagen alpha-1(I) chain-like n=1 Tax=Moschus berezovskii TaxID=68408 RepID=UPI002443FFD5|nr:collagen alpha-1(I) chain-like [Moschus berezovskii]